MLDCWMNLWSRGRAMELDLLLRDQNVGWLTSASGKENMSQTCKALADIEINNLIDRLVGFGALAIGMKEMMKKVVPQL